MGKTLILFLIIVSSQSCSIKDRPDNTITGKTKNLAIIADIVTINLPCTIIKVSNDVTYLDPKEGSTEAKVNDQIKEKLFYNLPKKTVLEIKCKNNEVFIFEPAIEPETLIFKQYIKRLKYASFGRRVLQSYFA